MAPHTWIPLLIGYGGTAAVLVVGVLEGWSDGVLGTGALIALCLMAALGAAMAPIEPDNRRR